MHTWVVLATFFFFFSKDWQKRHPGTPQSGLESLVSNLFYLGLKKTSEFFFSYVSESVLYLNFKDSLHQSINGKFVLNLQHKEGTKSKSLMREHSLVS